ncbi:hypothetical protein CSB45_01100 [candidate division KSB3 bacterium]|uniref:Uncharacterized protein n=1 Tax=candidate division KSB3 bacterium TaxID=2044937 RepID=A0A2G6EAC4_9BACT|nr:MAG: hypothetical protein CSB45_01100 [candidate division KSB3 bacterium]PIE30800.1 MAG: hypothetical protein CSA57_02250 [candidate division KSB3 bacterium]
MSTTETQKIKAYLHDASRSARAAASAKAPLTNEKDEDSLLIVPREYRSALSTFESPLMQYLRNLRLKMAKIPKEISFINSIYTLTQGNIIDLIDPVKDEVTRQLLDDLLTPLLKHAKQSRAGAEKDPVAAEWEAGQILNRCYLVLYSNFSQMQSAIIQGIIYDIERQGVHLPIQSSAELEIIAQQYLPVVQNQAVIIRNMFRHLFPEYDPPDNIHVLELCFLRLLDDIQNNFSHFLESDEQLLQMLSRIKVGQDELLNVNDPNLRNILAKMERLQNQFHDIYNQRWRDGVLNDIIATFFYHSRFTAYLENKGKIAKKRRYFLASLEHLLNNYEDFFNETLVPQVDFLTEEYKVVDREGYTFVQSHILTDRMKNIFQTLLDQDRFSVLSEMIVTGEFSKTPALKKTFQHSEELEKMRRELRHKHVSQQALQEHIDRLWEVLDDVQELLVSEIFTKWKTPLNTMLTTYCLELHWFHACFSTYTIEAFPDTKTLFRELDLFIEPYKEALRIFSDNIFHYLESISQQVYAFRDRAGDFNLLYTGILGIDLKQEERFFQFELYTPPKVKLLVGRLLKLQEHYTQTLKTHPPKQASDDHEGLKNQRLYTDEMLKTANFLEEERDILMYCGSRKLFADPQFVEDDFAHDYNEIIDSYAHVITQLQPPSSDQLDRILELRGLRERARFAAVYERYSEMVKYKALSKAWPVIRKRWKNPDDFQRDHAVHKKFS